MIWIGHVLLKHGSLGHGRVLDLVLGLGVGIGWILVDGQGIDIGARDGRLHGGGHLWLQSLGDGGDAMPLILVVGVERRSIVEGFGVEFEGLGVCIGILIIAHGWGHTVEFEADTGGAGPCVCGRGIAFDFASPTALACSHYCYSQSVCNGSGCRGQRKEMQGAAPLRRLCLLCSSTKT